MIVDVHCHLWGPKVPAESWFETLVRVGVSLSGSSEEKVRERIMRGQMDLSGDLLVADMEEAGIDKAIIFPLDFGLHTGTGEGVSLEEQHKIFVKAAERHPDRLIAWASVDPRRPNAAEFVERAVKEWGMKGLKLHPCIGEFYPDENYVYPLYKKCQELGIPISIHTGPEAPPHHGKFAHPIYVDEVADDFPGLKIILAHAGMCWWEEAASIAALKPNVYLDIAYWQVKSLSRPVWGFYYQLRWLMDTAGPHKVLFGSDWPALRLVRRVNTVNWVKLIKQPPDEAKAMGIDFAPEEINGLLGDNAVKLFSL